MNTTTISVGTLICDLTEKGIKLKVESGDLRLEAPKGRITPYVLRVLKDRKPEIIRELKGVHREFQLGKTAGLYRGAKLPNRIHLDEATRLLRNRGWVQIWSGYLNKHIYLVRNEEVKVPDATLSKYTESEIEALKDLSMEEIQTLHEAKIIFKGIISDKKPIKIIKNRPLFQS